MCEFIGMKEGIEVRLAEDIGLVSPAVRCKLLCDNAGKLYVLLSLCFGVED